MFDFTYKRNWKEAISFYIFYLLLGLIGAMIFGLFLISLLLIAYKANILDPNLAKSYLSVVKEFGINIYNIFTHIACFVLALLFIFKKKLKDFSVILLLFSVLLLSIFTGALFSLIPAAILSTFPNRNISE